MSRFLSYVQLARDLLTYVHVNPRHHEREESTVSLEVAKGLLIDFGVEEVNAVSGRIVATDVVEYDGASATRLLELAARLVDGCDFESLGEENVDRIINVVSTLSTKLADLGHIYDQQRERARCPNCAALTDKAP